MNREHIRQISVGPEGVYLMTLIGDGKHLLREWKHDGMTDVYQWDGQHGLDKEVFRMLCEGSCIQGRHRSTARYRRALRKGRGLLDEMNEVIRQAYVKLSQEDIASIVYSERQETPAALAHLALVREVQDACCEQLARLAAQPTWPQRFWSFLKQLRQCM